MSKDIYPRQLLFHNESIMPTLGFLPFEYKPNVAGELVEAAIKIGYRYIDSAWIHGNEEEVGKAIRSALAKNYCRRDQLFVSTKLWNNFHERGKVVEKIRETLTKTGLRYIDLYLIHWPFAFKEDKPTVPTPEEGMSGYSKLDYLETWKGMEDCFKLGLARNIGLCNFNSVQVQRIISNCKVRPFVNQIECHYKFNQRTFIEYCHGLKVAVTAYLPLGVLEKHLNLGDKREIKDIEEPIKDPEIHSMAKFYGKTPAQVVLNYLLSLKVAVLVHTSNEDQLKEYFDIYNFKLEEQHIKYLDLINLQRLYSNDRFAEHMHWPFGLQY